MYYRKAFNTEKIVLINKFVKIFLIKRHALLERKINR